MGLFTCKKYNFLIEKNLPSLSTPPPKIRGNSGTTLPKLSKHLPMGRCLGRVVGLSLFHRGFVGIPTDLSSDPSTCGVCYDKIVTATHRES